MDRGDRLTELVQYYLLFTSSIATGVLLPLTSVLVVVDAGDLAFVTASTGLACAAVAAVTAMTVDMIGVD